MNSQSNFLLPRSRYRGPVRPENLLFNANLQAFAQRVSMISGLQTNGKLSAAESFEQIQALWQQLDQSHDQLSR